jgi:hypothetical protein
MEVDEMLLRGDKRHLLIEVSGGQVPDGSRAPIEYNLYLVEDGEIDEEAISLGRVDDGSHIEGFFKYLELLDIQIEEANCTEIAEVFDLMQPAKSLLKSFDDLCFRRPGDILDEQEAKVKSGVRLRYTGEEVIFIDEEKEDVAERYRDVIRPPRFSEEGGMRRITFWMVDLATRDLERWEIFEDVKGERRVQGEIVEKDLVFSISVKVEDE